MTAAPGYSIDVAMKRTSLLAILMLTACSSATDVIDERTLRCDAGQDIEVLAGIDSPRPLSSDGTEDRFDLMVEVANNSHEDVTVKTLRVDQIAAHTTPYRISGYGRGFNQLIEQGKDHLFRLPVTGRAYRMTREDVIGGSSGLEISVTVVLSNGDSYRCPFAIGVRR